MTVSRIAGFVMLAALLSTAAPVAAQQTITFDDAVKIALDQNVALRRAKNTLVLQEQQVRADKAAFLPNLNASTSASRNWGQTFDQFTSSLVTRSSDGVSVGANTGVNLFNGFADVASLEQSRENVEAQKATLERSEQFVVFNVIQTYLSVILDQERIQIREEDLAGQQKQLERIDEFVRVGARPISDLYAQQALVAASEASLLDTQQSLQLNESRLIQVLQLDPLGAYTFTSPSSDDISLEPRSYDADDLFRSALERRPDLRAQRASINAAVQGIRIAKSSRLPRLNLSAGINTRYSSLSTDPITRLKASFADQFADNRSEFISLSLQIPIFNRFQTKIGVERSQVMYDNALLDMENLEQTIALDVRQSYLDYQTAVKRLEVTEKQQRSAQQALEVEQERYDIGASTLVELTQARARYVEAASGRVQAIFQFHFQHRLIEYYQGILNPNQTLF